ncbi:MAG TPA: polyribonucleotide nucleotidyltransferase [Patescibacteria group bacterium]|nr:polyribonucleotide nucleotidyltransferase [Patescibacteria group bacterium]
MDKKAEVSVDIAGKTLKLETGELAPQATSSVLATLGETVVLVTVVEGGKTDLDYFPLSVEYQERLYAGGIIKGSRWVKREGRPTDEAVLSGRIIDRSIRPLFPKAFKNEVQVIITVLSVDKENEADMLALNAVSAALAISRIPWNGPIGGIRMGYKDKNILVNPGGVELAASDLDLVVSQSKDKSVMIEAGALQVEESVLVDAVEKAHVETQKIIGAIEELVKKVGQKKLEVSEDSLQTEAVSLIDKTYKKEVEALIESRVNKEGGGTETEDLISQIYEGNKMQSPDSELDKKTIAKAVEYVMFKLIRAGVVEKKKRVDGRKMDEIRKITTRVGILPRTHGSALFQRGITQALSVVTLGSPRMEQLIESAEGEEKKRYIHHYSGLPYSFGQTGRVGSPSRREIGHGALAERALLAVIPKQDVFPYTIRVVSEVLSQNGSSSMASTCGSTLALMDAGVPITKPVAGISVGMMSDGEKYELLTDIIGLEDFSGDMDFKVAGTDTGVTAIQLDVKIPGLTLKQVKEILERAKTARLEILEVIKKTLPAPRTGLSKYAPKIELVKVPVEKIGEVIGPGGKVIKNIIATTGAQVDVEDDGSVAISGPTPEAVQQAVDWVKGLIRQVTPGEEFDGEVKRILPFGAFVEILPGKEGMVHVSKMAAGFVKDPNDVVTIGQKVKVKVVEIDDQGRINLTMLLNGETSEGGRGGSEDRGAPRPSFRGPDRRAGGGSSFQDRRQGPPRFERRPSFNRPVGPDANTSERSEHPLARQFRREKAAASSTRFKKTRHY